MKILTDTREQKPYAFSRFADVETERAALTTGDYSLPGLEDRAAIERKSLEDLIGCLKGTNRDRFERELARATQFELFGIVVEASLDDVSKGRYRSEMKAHAALQSIFAFQVRYRVPFLFCGNRAGAEYTTHSLLSKYFEEIRKRYQRAIKTQRETLV